GIKTWSPINWGPFVAFGRWMPCGRLWPSAVCMGRCILQLQNRDLSLHQFKIQNSKFKIDIALRPIEWPVLFCYYRQIVNCLYAHSKFKIQNSKLILPFGCLYCFLYFTITDKSRIVTTSIKNSKFTIHK